MKIISSLFDRLKGTKEIVPYLNDDRMSVAVDGVEWSTVNIGTDDSYPRGRLFSLAEALQMENEQWRLPTLEEVMELKKYQRTSNDRNQIYGIWFNFSSENNLFFPMNFKRKKEGFLPRLIGAYWTSTPDYPGHYIYEIESYYTWTPAPEDIKVGVRLVRK